MNVEGFESVADLWNERMSDAGNMFHNHLCWPEMTRATGDVRGLQVIDLGCGSGVSSRSLARAGAQVVGVDVSPTMIEHARRWEAELNLGITYITAHAGGIEELESETFDLAVANMVLMDIADAEGLIGEAERLLKPGGRFVASLIHPCFNITGGSSWLTEEIEDGQIQTKISRSVWRYRELFSGTGVVFPSHQSPVTNYHRPLSWYAQTLVEAGLLIDYIGEPEGDAIFAEKSPAFHARNQTVPVAMVLGAVKPGATG